MVIICCLGTSQHTAGVTSSDITKCQNDVIVVLHQDLSSVCAMVNM